MYCTHILHCVDDSTVCDIHWVAFSSWSELLLLDHRFNVILQQTTFWTAYCMHHHTSGKRLPSAVFSSPAFWRLTSFPRTEEPSGAKITDLGQICLALPLHTTELVANLTSCSRDWKQRRQELRPVVHCYPCLLECTKGIKKTEVIIHMMSELMILIVANGLSSYVVLIWDLTNPNTLSLHMEESWRIRRVT